MNVVIEAIQPPNQGLYSFWSKICRGGEMSKVETC